jgi:hypothetical protein
MLNDLKSKLFLPSLGAVVQSSKIFREAERQKKNTSAEELHIVGLTLVIIDCDLESANWHRTNVVIVADQLVVHKDVRWDVSGLDIQDRFQKAPNGQGSGSHGSPGKSLRFLLLDLCSEKQTFQSRFFYLELIIIQY